MVGFWVKLIHTEKYGSDVDSLNEDINAIICEVEDTHGDKFVDAKSLTPHIIYLTFEEANKDEKKTCSSDEWIVRTNEMATLASIDSEIFELLKLKFGKLSKFSKFSKDEK